MLFESYYDGILHEEVKYQGHWVTPNSKWHTADCQNTANLQSA